MDRELKRGTLEMMLLKLLSERRRYGYELVTALEERTDGRFDVTDGTLYPVLYRLEEAGWAETEWETREKGNPRKYYRITEPGREELERLVTRWRSFTDAIDRVLETENDDDA